MTSNLHFTQSKTMFREANSFSAITQQVEKLPNLKHLVLCMIEKDYKIFRGAFSSKVDPKQAWVLEREVLSLLVKGAIDYDSPPTRQGFTAGTLYF